MGEYSVNYQFAKSLTLNDVNQITETAARKIRTLMAKQGIDEGGLRVGVKGGGCSGLSYTFAWESEARFGDEVFEGRTARRSSSTRRAFCT